MTKVIYRYVRPVQFVEGRIGECEVQKKGGILLRFEEWKNSGMLWFAYARCHPNDYFSKAVAKATVDARADGMRGSFEAQALAVIPMMDISDNLLVEITRFCSSRNIHECLRDEMNELGDALAKIRSDNAIQQQKQQFWKDAMEAASLRRRYSLLEAELERLKNEARKG